MKTILILLAVAFFVMPPWLSYLWERKRRIKSEKALALVKEMGQIDDRIFRMRVSGPDGWPKSREAQTLITRRIQLYEQYSAFLGHPPLRDCAYVSDLMKSSLPKQ